MPKLTGIFADFDLEGIPPEDIARWLKPNPGLTQIENYLANKLLFPQTIPYSQFDLAVELAILRELVKRKPDKFQTPGKIFISKQLAERIGAIPDLTLALIDILKPKDVVGVYVGKNAVGSVIRPEIEPQGSFILEVEGKKYQFKNGSLSTLSCPSSRCHIRFIGKNAKMAGKEELSFETSGGLLGLLVDGRGF